MEKGAAKLDLWVMAKSRTKLPCGTSDEIAGYLLRHEHGIGPLRYSVSIFGIDISMKKAKKERADYGAPDIGNGSIDTAKLINKFKS